MTADNLFRPGVGGGQFSDMIDPFMSQFLLTVPAQSQLYSFIAPNTKSLLDDKGDPWAFVSDTPGVRNHYDVIPNSGMEVKDHSRQGAEEHRDRSARARVRAQGGRRSHSSMSRPQVGASGYLTATTSIVRMSGSLASRSGATCASASGI